MDTTSDDVIEEVVADEPKVNDLLRRVVLEERGSLLEIDSSLLDD